jgi:hypothetical protein
MLSARSSETSEQTNGLTRSNNAEGYRMTFRNFHGHVISCFLHVQYKKNGIQRHAMRHLQWPSLAAITFCKGLRLKQKRARTYSEIPHVFHRTYPVKLTAATDVRQSLL